MSFFVDVLLFLFALLGGLIVPTVIFAIALLIIFVGRALRRIFLPLNGEPPKEEDERADEDEDGSEAELEQNARKYLSAPTKQATANPFGPGLAGLGLVSALLIALTRALGPQKRAVRRRR